MPLTEPSFTQFTTIDLLFREIPISNTTFNTDIYSGFSFRFYDLFLKQISVSEFLNHFSVLYLIR
jgi:hypothetical protein